MAQRIFFILVVCFLFFNTACSAQQKSVEYFPSFVAKPLFDQHYTLEKIIIKRYGLSMKNPNPLIYSSFKENKAKIFCLSPDFYSSHTGFFCQQELKLEKATSISFRLRLGSVDYTDYLEQKPNAKRY